MRITTIAALLVATNVTFAQYSNDPSTPFLVASAANDQVQPKVVEESNGGAWISWFDNRAGGYDVYAQHLSIGGVPSLGANGLLIADRNYSSTVDYDMDVDRLGAAYLAYRSDAGGVTHIVVTKLISTGAVLWSTQVTTAANSSAANPRVCVLDTGEVVCGWSNGTGFSMRTIDVLGNTVGTENVVTEAGRSLSLADVCKGEGGTVIAMWIRPFTTNFLSNKWLHAQKYDLTWNPLWGSSFVPVYAPTGAPYGAQGGSIQNGYFPSIKSDTNGGMVAAWYENTGPRLSYVQHIDAQGHLKFPVHGLATGTEAGRIKVGASLAYDHWRKTYYVVSPETNASTQSINSVQVQKISDSGVLEFGPNGVTVFGQGTPQPSFVWGIPAANGVTVLGMTTGSSGLIWTAGVGALGSNRFGVASPANVSTTGGTKSRLAAAETFGGDAVGAWTDNSDMAAGRVNPQGTIGLSPTLLCEIGLSTPSYLGILQETKWQVELTQGATVELHDVRPDIEGVLRFSSDLVGAVDVRLKGFQSLTKAYSSVDFSTNFLEHEPIYGDIDGDNEVGPGDFALLSTSFGAVTGDLNWDFLADLDGDLEVGPSDFSILSGNFGLAGD